MTAFRRFWALGYRTLLPITPPGAQASPNSTLFKRPGDMGKTPGVLGPYGWHSFAWHNHATLEADLDRWAGMGAGTGIRCGEQPDGTYLALVDADTLNAILAALIAEHVLAAFGVQPLRIGRAPKAGTVLRLSGPLTYRRVDFDDGVEPGKLARVEILTAGRQFVAEGIHPVTLRPYAWPVPLVPFDELPVFDPAAVLAFLDKLAAVLPAAKAVAEGAGAAVDQAVLRGDTETVRRAVAATPNTSALFPTREAYLSVGYAVKAAVSDEAEARDIWGDWCGRWSDGVNDPERDDAEWRRMKPPFRRGASWLYELAEKHGDGSFSRAQMHFEEPAAEADEPLFGLGGADDDPAEGVEPVDLFATSDPAELGAPPPHSLPDTIEAWARCEARRKGVSTAFASAAALGVLAAAIGSSLMIRPRLHDTGWVEPASLWVALIAGPGRGKSPVIAAAVEPLAQLDRERWQADSAAHARWAAADAAHRRKRDPGPPPGPEPLIRRSLVDDATLERQVRIHADNPRGLLRAPDELRGLFASLGAYKKNAEGDRTSMLRLFEGRRVVVDRVGSGPSGPTSIRAEHALMGIVAGTQPDKIRDVAADLGQDGMLQRFTFVLDDGVERDGVDEAPDERAGEDYRAVVRYLATAEHGAAKIVAQTGEARALLAEALRAMRRLGDLPGASEAWRGHVEKWPKLLHRIALVFHAVRHVEAGGTVLADVPLDADTARQAVAYGWFLMRHSLRFYETFVGESAVTGEARTVAAHMLLHPERKVWNRRDVYQAQRTLRGEKNGRALQAAMRELENLGWATAMERDVEGAKRWAVNPRVHIAFAAHAERERAARYALRDRVSAASQAKADHL